jgi:hypothetical protein
LWINGYFETQTRAADIQALRAVDAGDFELLMAFVRT